jgi:hypothetical protein
VNHVTSNPFLICHAYPWEREKQKEDAMRFLLPAIGIVVLIVTGTVLQIHFPSKQVAVADASLSVPIYKIQADYVKTLPEQEAPLP